MKIAVAGGTGAVGTHLADVARKHGHDVTVLTRSTGFDLTDRRGLAAKLADVDVVIDVTSISTRSGKKSERFFGTVTTNLISAEQEAGVSHHMALSIVGSDRAPFGYYAGKRIQERLVSSSGSSWTILRTTQFHEFAQQLYKQVMLGPINLVPTMISQPVAAQEVAIRLVALAEAGPTGRATDLAGTEVHRMVDMVKAYARATGGRGPIWEIPLPGKFGEAMRKGTLTASPAADLGTQTYGQWIDQLSHRTSEEP